MIVVVPDAHALSVHTTLSTIRVLLFARLLAERIASKGRPDLSQMINLLPRNRICSTFISTPVNVRLTLSPPRSPPFPSNKFLLNADRRLCTPKRQSSALSSRLPISRSGARHAKTSSYRAKNFLQAPPISILRKSGFEVATFSEVWLLLAGAVADDRPGLSGTGRSGDVAALVISLRLDTNHKSLLTHSTR
jgi:hypothetical protein